VVLKSTNSETAPLYLKASNYYVNPRGYLYVPADNADRLAKSVTRGADAIIIDLEDGVAPSDKVAARINATQFIESTATECEIWVRINEDSINEDLAAIVHAKVLGVVAAKSSSAAYLQTIASKLSEIEASRGLSRPLSIIPLVESAQGILNLE